MERETLQGETKDFCQSRKSLRIRDSAHPVCQTTHEDKLLDKSAKGANVNVLLCSLRETLFYRHIGRLVIFDGLILGTVLGFLRVCKALMSLTGCAERRSG